MKQRAIPFLLMRGGTSRGPYIKLQDLPEDRQTFSEVLLAMIGSGHPLNIDGIGGGASVTTKVAILSKSSDEWAEIDYLFAQVGVEERIVDFKPTCGNILSGVGPAALEMGLVEPSGEKTEVKIRATNTGARVLAKVETPGGVVSYDGNVQIDGVPGTAAPVELQFMDTVGGVTGAMLPTGNRIDEIDGVEVTCLDIAMPIIIGRAVDFGLTGFETPEDLDGNSAFRERIESIRVRAGERMGMGDVRESVTPKFAVVSSPGAGGTINARYFMPWKCHPSMAVTGAQCLACCVLIPGTVAEGAAQVPPESQARLKIEHPSGCLEVMVDYALESENFELKSAGLVRTARKLAAGEIYIPGHIWRSS